MKPTMVVTVHSPSSNYWVVSIGPESGWGMVTTIPCHNLRAANILGRALANSSPMFYPFKDLDHS